MSKNKALLQTTVYVLTIDVCFASWAMDDEVYIAYNKRDFKPIIDKWKKRFLNHRKRDLRCLETSKDASCYENEIQHLRDQINGKVKEFRIHISKRTFVPGSTMKVGRYRYYE